MDRNLLLREAVSTFYSQMGSIYEQQYGTTASVIDTDSNYLLNRGRHYGRGEDPFVYRTVWELFARQYHSRILCRYNEFAVGAVENRINYIAGEDGFSVEAQPKESKDAYAIKLAKQTQEFIEIFEEANAIEELQAESMRRFDEDGEWFMRLFFRKDGMTDLRFSEPEFIMPPVGDTTNPAQSFGIETPPKDIRTVLKYWVMEDPSNNTQVSAVPESEIVHGKINSTSTAKRGYPTFLPIEPNLRRCEEILASLSQIARTRAKIAMIRRVTGADSQTANALLESLTAKKRVGPTGEVTNVEQWKNGTIVTSNDRTQYEFPDYRFGSTDFVEVLQAELRAIAVRFGMPEWMFTALADAKYNNAFIVEAPTMKAFSRLQRKLHRLWITGRVGQHRSVYWRAILHAIRSGLLPREVATKVKLVANGPVIVSRDRKQEAELNKIYLDMGAKDLTTVQREQGLDPEEVHASKVTEFKEGKAVIPLQVSTSVSQCLLQMSGGQLHPDAGYKLISSMLGLPAELVKQAYPLPEKQPPQQVQPGQIDPPAPGDKPGSTGEDDSSVPGRPKQPVPLRESFKEEDHPRDDSGKFVSGSAIDAAKNDPAKAEELRAETTDPEQRAKLDKALGSTGGEADSTGEKDSTSGEKKEKKARAKATTPEGSPIRKLKKSQALTSDMIHELTKDDPRPTSEILSDIAKRVAYDSGMMQQHGMSSYVNTVTLNINGMKLRIDKSLMDKVGQTGAFGKTLVELVYPQGYLNDTHKRNQPTPIPAKLIESTKEILLTSQRNSMDLYWEKTYGMANFKSMATGGDGKITVYNVGEDTEYLTRRIFTHEAGHNLAKSLWNATDPAPDSDYNKIQQEEEPVTSYGRNAPGEDFAEAVMLYVNDNEYLQEKAPKKFAEIKKLLGE